MRRSFERRGTHYRTDVERLHRSDVTALRSVTPKKGIRLHRPRFLDAVETTELDGIPITTVAQTLLDVAAPAYRLNMGKLLHEAIVRELFDLNGFRECWRAVRVLPWRGASPRH